MMKFWYRSDVINSKLSAADDETALTEGGRVTNIEIIDEGWWIGVSNGRKGMFPASYVQLD